MVMQAGPVVRAVRAAKTELPAGTRVVYTSPQGSVFTQETAKRLAISRADHLQQRRLNQKALSTEIAATDRLIALNDREETLVRRERALRPVATTYNMLKAIHEHERKSENRENADAIRETLRLIYNANSTPGSWIHEVENEYLRSRQQGHRPGSEVVASSARPLPTVAANMPGY